MLPKLLYSSNAIHC